MYITDIYVVYVYMYKINGVDGMVTGCYYANFDPQTFREYVEIVGKGNIRKSLQEYMQQVIAMNKQDIKGIKINILNLEIESLQKDLSKIQAKLQKKVSIKQEYETGQAKQKEEQLRTEAKEIEKAQHCQNCGSLLGKKTHQFKIGEVCHHCFLNGNSEDIKRWNNEQTKSQGIEGKI